MAAKKNGLNHQVVLMLGDWSGDGHGKTERYVFWCNRTPHSLRKDYTKGSTKVGVNLEQEVADDYEDDALSTDQAKKLTDAGIPVKELLCRPVTDGYLLTKEEFADLWLRIARVGNPRLKWEPTKDSCLRIGG